MRWPYPVHYGKENELACDVLVLGGGIAGCWTAIAAARKGAKVIIVEKGVTRTSGAGGSGVDHWHAACTNPASKVSPEDSLSPRLKTSTAGVAASLNTSPAAKVTNACWNWRRWG